MKAYEQTNGVRILDFLDLHYYPAANRGRVIAGGRQFHAGPQAAFHAIVVGPVATLMKAGSPRRRPVAWR